MLAGNEFGVNGVAAILERSFAPTLEELDIESTNARDEGAVALGEAAPPRLVHIDLAKAGLTDAGASALVRSRLRLQLEWLRLSDNRLTDAAALELAGAAWPKLRSIELYLNEGRFRAKAKRALWERFGGALICNV